MKISLMACAGLLALPFTPLSAYQGEAPSTAADYRAEIENLRDDARMSAAFAHISENHAANLQNMVRLNEVPAPPFAEEARAQVFADMMRATGFGEVTIDEVGNVIAHRPGTAATRSVMMVAHLDTVFPAGTDVTVQVEGNRYTAPGIGDNTRGAIMLLEIASAIAAADLRTQGDIVLVGNVGEEGLGDLRGVRHLFREEEDRPDSFIAIDGGDDARLVTSAVGSTRFRVSFNGPGGHSWGDFGDPNPHHASARAIEGFVNAARPITQEGPRASYNIGRTGGGTSVNSIPFESWFEVDMRSGDPAKLEALEAAFQQAMTGGLEAENAVRGDSEPLTLTIEPIGSRPAGATDPASPLVQRASALLEADGLMPVLTASSTDSNIPISLGIPALTISRCGTSARAHSLDEYWENDETVPACTMRGLALLVAEAELVSD